MLNEVVSGIFGLGGDIFSSAMSLKGQREANAMNMQLAREQMSFQERMSSTAHQREVADLRAANLNPVLSAKYGGASTPSGAMATMVNPHQNTKIRGLELASALSNVAYQKELARGARADATLKEQETEMRTSKVGKAMEWLRLFSNSAGGLLGTAGNFFAPSRAVRTLGQIANSAQTIRPSRNPRITYGSPERS